MRMCTKVDTNVFLDKEDKVDLYEENIELLYEGFWYSDLPPLLNLKERKQSLINLMEDIDKGDVGNFSGGGSNQVIKKLQKINSPMYLHKDGCETIEFYDFKNNGSFRELQIPNFELYTLFVYNTMKMYFPLFRKLYHDPELVKNVSSSNSAILFNEAFNIKRGYENIDITEGIFAVKNNKTVGLYTYDANRNNYLKKQGTKLYSVKLDMGVRTKSWSKKEKLCIVMKRKKLLSKHILKMV